MSASAGSSPSIGIPSAFLLHGYVGFIFGSVKANPWWSSPLMPVVFMFSRHGFRYRRRDVGVHVPDVHDGAEPDRHALRATRLRSICSTSSSSTLRLEMLDLVHRIYEADESFHSLDFMVHTRLYFSHRWSCRFCWAPCCPSLCWRLTQVVKLIARVRKQHLCAFRMPDADRHLCHALECSDRWSALFEKLSRIYHIQDGLRRERRPADGDRADHSYRL